MVAASVIGIEVPDTDRIFAVVLAAGRGERFGRTKQLERINDESLIRRALRVAADAFCDRVLLVAGHEAAAVIEAAGDRCRFFIVNENYDDGIGRSISCAVESIAHAADAVLVMLADQALVTAGHLRAILAVWNRHDNAIVATAFTGAKGPPVLLPKAAFDDLRLLRGDSGARDLLSDPRFEVTTVWSDDAGVDIDSIDDLDRVRRNVRS